MSRATPLDALPEAVADIDALDAVAGPLGKPLRELAPSALKDVLSGTWLGHAVHPLLIAVPIGTWTSAVLLDLLGGEDSEDRKSVV